MTLAVAMATAASGAYASGGRTALASGGRTIHVSGASAGALAHSAAATAPQILGGFTAQGWPVVVDFSKDHKQIRLVETGLQMKCTSGMSFPELDGWVRLPISAGGRVHATTALSPQTGTNASLSGGTDTFTGQFNRKRTRLTGTWELRQTFSLPNGQVDQCDSGRVGFVTVV